MAGDITLGTLVNDTSPETGNVSTETRVTDWRKFWLIPCIIVTVSLGLYFAVSGGESREWTAAGDSFSGQFEKLSDGKVQVRDDGGTLREIPWDDLGEADHAFLKEELEDKVDAEYFPDQDGLVTTPEQEDAGMEVWTDREGHQIVGKIKSFASGIAVFEVPEGEGEDPEGEENPESDEAKYIYEYISNDGQTKIKEQTKTTGELGTLNYTMFCIMFFLEFGIWGAWYVVLGSYLDKLGFSRKDIGRIYGTMAIGAMISPMFVGFLADKVLGAKIVLGVLQLLGAFLLFTMAKMKTPQAFFWTALVYALAYSPTLSLVNAIVLGACQDAKADAEIYFPLIRVFGTIGWIVAGLSHRFIIKKDSPMNERPILLAAALSLVLGLFSFTLPKAVIQGGDLSFGEFFGELGKDITAVPLFFVVTLIIAMSMGTYFAFGALFVEKKSGVKAHEVGSVMAIGQFVEIAFMLSLPWFLKTLGMNTVLVIGISAWALRFGLFSIGKPLALILIGVGLHGICFDFFFAAGMIHISQVASASILNSAQMLFGFLAYGLGLFLGTELSGRLNQYCTTSAAGGAPPGAVPEELV